MNDIASEHRLIMAKRVDDTPVFDPAGERIGHVEDISIEKLSGKVVYAILSFGGFLGVGEKFHPLPWSILKYDTARGGYVIPLDKAQLQNAPSYDRSDLAELGGGERGGPFGERIFAYYAPFGAVPYW